MIPYGRQRLDEQDIEAVTSVLRSDWLTTGPLVEAFEHALAERVGAAHAVAVSSGTAALHLLMQALDLEPGDEVIVPALTFVATAGAVLHAGGTPRVVDVEADTLLIDPQRVQAALHPRTRAVIAVDYAGQPCDYDALRAILPAEAALLADACHALGATAPGGRVGALADASTFSFHPVKPITTAEGGMITTADAHLARRLRRLRNHGMDRDAAARAAAGVWSYDIAEPGFNYRLSDLHCALGLSQLSRLDAFAARRREIADRYDRLLADCAAVAPLRRRESTAHAWHLYVVQLAPGLDRDRVFETLRARGIGVNVHYRPLHLFRLMRSRLGTGPGDCPAAEAAAHRILSLPIYVGLEDAQVDRIADELRRACEAAA